MSRTIRLSSTVALVALAAVLSLSSVPVDAATSAHITVTPSINLRNNQTVTVSGGGYAPNENVYVLECLYGAQSATNCNIFNNVPLTTDANGNIPTTKFKVKTGKIGNGLCGTTAKNIRACDITVGNQAGTDFGIARLTFFFKKK
jgi:Neocarzinostatin family